jgi:hypothetical protein
VRKGVRFFDKLRMTVKVAEVATSLMLLAMTDMTL